MCPVFVVVPSGNYEDQETYRHELTMILEGLSAWPVLARPFSEVRSGQTFIRCDFGAPLPGQTEHGGGTGVELIEDLVMARLEG